MLVREKIRVTFADTDALGVVYYANYLKYFERAGAEWFRKFDKPFAEYTAQGLYFIVTEIHVRYIRPARYDEVVTVECKLGHLDKFRFRLDYKVLAGPKELLVEGHVWHVMINRDGKIRRLPQSLLEHSKECMPQGGKDGEDFTV